MIKMAGAQQVIISGTRATNQFNFNVGWNFMPMLCEEPVYIDSLLASGQRDVTIIKEIAGLNVYWPEAAIYSLNTLLPGKAYLIKATAAGVMVFPE